MTTLLSPWPPADDRKCPHARIEFCPLYVAAHEAGGFGCDDGRVGEGGCAVSRGMNYGSVLAKLSHAKRDLVQDCAEREGLFLKLEQRRRNMKNAGLH
jgi:hypothetical protein